MRVRSNVESSLRQSSFTDGRNVKAADFMAAPVTTTPITTDREAPSAAPVTASTSAKFSTRTPQSAGGAPARSAQIIKTEQAAPGGFTADVEGSKPANSRDRLELSTAARRKSADESSRATTDAKQASVKVGTTSVAVTATVATMLDIRV